MNCKKCDTENLDSAKFCKKCGQDLSQKEIKQAKPKRSVKISKGKIKFMIIAVVIIGLVGAGAMTFKKKVDEKRILSVEYLEDLDKRGDEECKIFDDIQYKSMSEKEIDAGLDKCAKIIEEMGKATNIFVVYAKESEFKDNAKIEEFIKKYDLLAGSSDGNKKDWDEESKELANIKYHIKTNSSEFKKKTGFNEEQSEKFIGLMEEVLSFSKLFDDIKIEKKTEQVEASYTEQENNKIPVGYSIITTKPQNGEKENVKIIVDGKEKGSGEIVIKEPQNGIKMIGSGDTEDIAKQAEDKLNQIIKLWQEQNFTAATILPFLTEESQNKAPEFESSYKKIIFNWRRFDKVEPILNQASFKENTTWSQKNETYPFIVYLPVTVSYYVGKDVLKIPFYYSTKKNEWISGNGTIAKLFEIIKYQSIEAEISPKSFAFIKAGDCKKDKEVEIKNINVNGVDNLRIDFSSSSLRQIKFIVTINDSDSSTKVDYSSSLPLALIDFANKNKSTVLIGKDFEYNSYFDGNCLCNSNISFAFFK